MKLLFDQNLSPRLVDRLADLYPGSVHVQSLGLEAASDDALWRHARAAGFVILTKDEDFNDLATIRGFPPKVVWLQLGNCTTADVEAALRTHQRQIEAMASDSETGTLMLR